VALTLSLQGIDIIIVYAVWSGVGTLLVAVIGVLLFKESISIKKVFSLLLIILGVLGIHLANVLH
jgi:small multidrug resistance pump